MSDTRVHCNYCHRRSISVARLTGLLVPHRTKPGRRGHYCQGSERAPEARPVERAA
jgi:hypothetical protein